MRFKSFPLCLLFASVSASAGFFDDVVNKAKQAADQVMDQTVESVSGNASNEQEQQAEEQTPPVKSQQPAATGIEPGYDAQLVKSVQQQLKNQGYLTGTVDGIYGNGTRRAILAYEKNQGLPEKGLPTNALLKRLQATKNQSQAALTANNTSIDEPSSNVSDKHKATDSGVIRNVVIDGVNLGMSQANAVAALRANGFSMESPGQPDALVGIRVKGKKISEDGKGSIKVYISTMNGKVYQFVEEVMYLPNRLPSGKTWADLEAYYKKKLLEPFESARYRGAPFRGRTGFDDETPPPYIPLPKTPHAEVYFSINARTGLVVQMDMNWKNSVGATW